MFQTLNKTDSKKLRMANQFLTEITRKHSTFCECLWCIARVNTDVQNDDAYTMQYVSYPEAEE